LSSIFKGYTVFSSTVDWCRRLQLTRLAQWNWAGHLMVFREVVVYECLSVVSAQDVGSNGDFASDHWFVCCDPVLKVVNLGDLGKMDVWTGFEIFCAAMVKARIFERVQCSDLSLCGGKAYLLFGFGILSMSGFISSVPFILTFLPYQSDEIAGPSYSVILVGLFEGLGRNILLLKLLPFGRPSPKDEVIPPDAVLALNKWGKAMWN
jgi:hypothetical protein